MTNTTIRASITSRLPKFLGLGLMVAGMTCMATVANAQDYSTSSSALGYTTIIGNGTSTDISTFTDDGTATGTADGDEGFRDVNIPFTFEFFGTQQNVVRLSCNGFMTFDLTVSGNTFSGITSELGTTGGPAGGIFFFGDDCDFDVNSMVASEVVGNPGSQMLIIEFKDIPEFVGNNDYSCQIVLHEGTNEIELRYDNTFTVGSGTHVRGVENMAETVGRGAPDTTATNVPPANNFTFTPSTGDADLAMNDLILVPFTNPTLVGDMVAVDTIVENSGTADATNDFVVEIYLSVDATIDGTDQLLTSFTVTGGLAIGAQDARSTNVTIPTPNPMSSGRDYFIGAFVDRAMANSDINSTNNTLSRAQLIGPEAYTVVETTQSGFVSVGADPNVQVLFDSTAASADDGELAFMMPFNFDFFGQTVNMGDNVNIGFNGYLEFFDPNTETGGGLTNDAIPDTTITGTSPVAAIMAAHDDLDFDMGTGAMVFALVSTNGSGNQVLTVEWIAEDFGTNVSDFHFQIVIEENTNIICINYNENAAFTISGTWSATIGVRGPGGVDGVAPNNLMGTAPSVTAVPTTNYKFIPAGQGGGNQADLVPSNVMLSPSTTNVAGMTMVSAQIDNSGLGAAGAFDVQIILSEDNMVNAGDLILDTQSVTMLAASANTTVMSTVSIPTGTALPNPTGGTNDYFVLINVNPNASVIESDFGNNVASGTLTLQAATKDQGDIDGDGNIDVNDVVACITAALDADPASAGNVSLADLNGDNVVNVLDVQISINRVLAAP